MKDLLDKIGSYNIFNYLFPGVLFAVLVSKFTGFRVLQDNILTGGFLYYFIGSSISRVGSLAIEPLLKKLNLIVFTPYEKYVEASRKDQKLEVLSEANNTYRTICATLLCVLAAVACEWAIKQFNVPDAWVGFALIASLIALYLLSYRKQTMYIVNRVSAVLNQTKEDKK